MSTSPHVSEYVSHQGGSISDDVEETLEAKYIVQSPLFDQTPPLMWQGLRAKTGFGKVHGWALADSRDTDVYISAMSPSTKGGLYYT